MTQGELFNPEEQTQNSGPVTCLGIEFPDDKARREHFTNLLREKLQDPEFRKIEGFPIGEDEDILELSDPPYYTACPNPWIADFIEEWEKEKKTNPNRTLSEVEGYQREPFATDVSEGKNDPIYNAHSYHTKVPHKAIMRYILHYTEPGDIVFDGFCGTGMTGVAAQMCGDRDVVLSLGYQVKADGTILQEDTDENGKKNYTIWSDVFVCPECTGEVVYWECAVEKESRSVNDEFICSHCSAKLSKRNMERQWITKYDIALQKTVKQAKQVPVMIVYTITGNKGRFEKEPGEADLALIEKIEKNKIPYWYPTYTIPIGEKTPETLRIGITHQHHLYQKRNLWIISCLFEKLKSKILRLVFQSVVSTLSSKLVRYNFCKRGNGILTGTIYVPSLNAETIILKVFSGKVKDFIKALKISEQSIVNNGSCSNIPLPETSLDYIFIDPPFGANLQYSELNLFWEGWLSVFTNNTEEAIESRAQKKGLIDYRSLMAKCFNEAYRALKPGRWMTVEFSNTKASIWNSIQTALTEAGFIVANVSALDKKQGSFNAVSNPISVKQDLVISAYKPNGGFEERFVQEAQTEEGVWDFVRTHLKYLPVSKKQGHDLVAIPERDPRILYDQVISYYVRKGYNIPIDSKEFQLGLAQRFSERDEMFFLPEQVAEYDRKKMIGGGRPIQPSLFVSDEASAIEWLRNIIRDKPQTFQDLNPQFMKEISGWNKNEVGLELSTLLEQNFLSYDGKGPVPDQIHSYLSSNWKDMRNLLKQDPALVAKAKGRWYVPDPSKAGDLEKLREKALLKEFEEYKQVKKKLRIFRLEAVRAGFKKAWQERDYDVIISVAKKIPESVLEEDPKLLMWYDQAVTRTGVDS